MPINQRKITINKRNSAGKSSEKRNHNAHRRQQQQKHRKKLFLHKSKLAVSNRLEKFSF